MPATALPSLSTVPLPAANASANASSQSQQSQQAQSNQSDPQSADAKPATFSKTLSASGDQTQTATPRPRLASTKPDEKNGAAAVANGDMSPSLQPVVPAENADPLVSVLEADIGSANTSADTIPQPNASEALSPIQSFLELLGGDIQSPSATAATAQDTAASAASVATPVLPAPIQQVLTTLAQLQQQWDANNAPAANQQSAASAAAQDPNAAALLKQLADTLQNANPQSVLRAAQITIAQFQPAAQPAQDIPQLASLVAAADVVPQTPATDTKAPAKPVITAAPAATNAPVQTAKTAQPVAAPTPESPKKEISPEPLSASVASETTLPETDSKDAQTKNGQTPAFLSNDAGVLPAPVSNNNQPAASTFAQLVQQPQTPDASPAEQLVAQIKNITHNGENHIQIQLSPADLGKLDIHMIVAADGKTTLQITADNSHTLQVLQSDARSLEQSLRNIGLNAGNGSLSFNLSSQQQSAGQYTPQQGRTYQAQQQTADEALAAAPTQTYSLSSSEGLDIRI